MTTPAEPLVEEKRLELVECGRRIEHRKEAQDQDFALRRQLFRDLIEFGVRKSEIARIAGVSHPMVNDALGKNGGDLMTRPAATLEERFWSKVDKSGECWLWTASTKDGYGTIYVLGKMEFAHRVSYELNVGPIPEGLQIDHVQERGCSSRACVRPDHLEPVTGSENVRRAVEHRKKSSAV